jgi:uncharacterized protein
VPDLFRRTLAAAPLVWRTWSSDALREAQERQVPLVIFCGDSLDHWSAVLAAELSADHEVCTLIDNAFVAVAAERLSDPALAARSQEVLALTADAQGFPCVLFCTPNGAPFGAVPWRPVRDREQQIGLARIVLNIAETWQGDPESMHADAQRLQAILATAQAASGPGKLPRPALTLEAADAAFAELGDPLEGGFGPAPRHLGTVAASYLAQRLRRDDAPLMLTRLLERTVLAWAHGAACDQLAGGLHRGVTDRAWRTPFFEQRLVDQATAASAWCAAATTLTQPALRVAAERALQWTIDHLRRDDGHYVVGLHADALDAQGLPREGAFHTWTLDAIAAIVGDEHTDLLAERFDLVGAPLVEGGHPLAVRAPIAAGSEARLAAALQRLAVARGERTPPLRDDRRDARGEGLLLVAFADVRRESETNPALLAAGQALATVLTHDHPSEHRAGDAAAIAWGLARWGGNDDAAHAWLQHAQAQRSGDGRLPLSSEPTSSAPSWDPPTLDVADDDRGPSAAAMLAQATHLLCGPDAAMQVIAAHAGSLRHGAAVAGLLTVWDALTTR